MTAVSSRRVEIHGTESAKERNSFGILETFQFRNSRVERPTYHESIRFFFRELKLDFVPPVFSRAKETREWRLHWSDRKVK